MFGTSMRKYLSLDSTPKQWLFTLNKLSTWILTIVQLCCECMFIQLEVAVNCTVRFIAKIYISIFLSQFYIWQDTMWRASLVQGEEICDVFGVERPGKRFKLWAWRWCQVFLGKMWANSGKKKISGLRPTPQCTFTLWRKKIYIYIY